MAVVGPELLRELWERHAAALVLSARVWCDTPDEVVQEAYWKLAQLEQLPENAAAWLFQVVRNLAISSGRASRRRRHHETRAALTRDNWFEANPAAPLDALAATEALAALSDEDRQIVVARIWGGLTWEQVGVLVGRPTATVHRRYQAALSALREKLETPCRPPTN